MIFTGLVVDIRLSNLVYTFAFSLHLCQLFVAIILTLYKRTDSAFLRQLLPTQLQDTYVLGKDMRANNVEIWIGF